MKEHPDEIQTHLHKLVGQIDMPLSPQTRAAFLSVDRGWFVPQYYRHVGTERQLELTGEHAYQDLPLTTKIAHDGTPISSSSMPSVMAAMLEALDLQPGMQVLEIGTGTGYNAAILSTIIGRTGQVVSVDIDPSLVSLARLRLEGAGIENVLVCEYDGYQGYPLKAPYDCIIATAGFHKIPQAWQEQLAPAGILVGNLIGNLTSILIRLVKQDDGSLVGGSPLPNGVFFMELRSDQIQPQRPVNWAPYDEKDAHQCNFSFDLPALLKQQAFLLYLSSYCPQLQLYKRYNDGPVHDKASIATWLIDPQSYESLSICNDRVYERGSLSKKITSVFDQWEQQGQPALNDFIIHIYNGDFILGMR